MKSQTNASLVRTWLAVMALLNGAFAAAGIAAGVMIVARTRIALRDARAPEEFGQSMFAGASALLLAGFGTVLALASLADWWLYRRFGARKELRPIDWFLVLVTSLPAVCAAVGLIVSTIRI